MIWSANWILLKAAPRMNESQIKRSLEKSYERTFLFTQWECDTTMEVPIRRSNICSNVAGAGAGLALERRRRGWLRARLGCWPNVNSPDEAIWRTCAGVITSPRHISRNTSTTVQCLLLHELCESELSVIRQPGALTRSIRAFCMRVSASLQKTNIPCFD